ncbi:hypothetical protein F4679DRAFT_587635 [Xylaria curta]|nr:hypothetical protein F4679DRAFT_587635 [Xylaria curta]
MSQIFELHLDVTVFQQSSFKFGMSIAQVLLGLSVGGSVCLISEEMRSDPVPITEVISKQNVSFTCATPSYSAYPDSMPAGFAFPSETIYIVDEQMCLLPLGLPGETVIGGAYIAAGYLNQEDLTKQSFVPSRRT